MNTNPETEAWSKVTRVRDILIEKLLDDPRVSLIDIGYDPADRADSKQVVVRVHFSQESDLQAVELPTEIDGVNIHKMVGDYKLE